MNTIKQHKKELETVSNTPNNKGRRKALSGMIVGGAAVTLWHKPVVNSVMLPAHAQTSATQDFYATVANATAVTVNAKTMLDVLIPSAHALVGPSNELPLADLKFEAEAIDQGSGMYKLKIAAEEIPDDKGSRVAPRDFVFGWEGTITGLNNGSSFTATGCAQTETVVIKSIGTNSMSIEMSYFSKTIALDLVDGSADLPAFPLSCNT